MAAAILEDGRATFTFSQVQYTQKTCYKFHMAVSVIIKVALIRKQ
jgi:hypothetical protein